MRWLVALLFLSLVPSWASAQPFNVRSWYAKGQVFVIWQFPAPPVNQTDTVEIYSSAAAQVNVANMTRIGRMFYPEYTGARLQSLFPGARLQVPTPAGGFYRLAADEGCFAYTPRAAGNLFFAVVDTGAVVVNAGNSTAAAFNYDPVNDPIIPHPQFNGTTPAGNPYTAMVVFADGVADYNNSRPDFPVVASEDKNGVPHVFAISRPVNGLPAGPLSCVFALHGGGGEYQLFLPGVPARANLSLQLNDGIVVTPDDSIFSNDEGVLLRSNTSWLGYSPEFDPFLAGVRPPLADTAVVVNYTSRRVQWILDWLKRPTSPFSIDPSRVAIIGHSGGGRGTSLISRQRPEDFCAAIVYTPASDLTLEDGDRDNFMQGDWTQNLDTNLVGPGGVTLGVTDIFTMTTRISPTERDFALTRFFYGKRDTEGPAAWSPSQRGIIDLLNASRRGYMIFWDEREHGVEKWDLETSDATDGFPDPWPDVAQWIVPPATIGGGKTERARVQYLVDTYRNNQSYPGFFNSDTDPLLAGRQPDPGDGDPANGEPWGTWTGYFDWETSTLTDAPNSWACTIYATGLAASPIDNALVASITTDLVPRRTANFNPAEGSTVYWYVIDPATNALLQSGSSIAEAEGVVQVSGISVPADPARVRVILCAGGACVGDANSSGAVTFADITTVLANIGGSFAGCDTPGDSDKNGSVNFADITSTLANFGTVCP